MVDTLVMVSLLPSFLPANSYMSPKMPAKVLRKFFMVSSASSATDVWLCGGAGRVDAVVDLDPVDVCEAKRVGAIEKFRIFKGANRNGRNKCALCYLPAESRLPTLLSVGARSVGCSGKSDDTLLKLP